LEHISNYFIFAPKICDSAKPILELQTTFCQMRLLRYLSILMLAATLSVGAMAQQHFQPINRNATPEAKALLERLYQTVDNGQIISGIHHNELFGSMYKKDLERIEAAAQVEPLIWGGDLAWDAGTVVEMASEQYQQGHIITLMWHAPRPIDSGIVSFKEHTQGKFTKQQWDELTQEGTSINRKWIRQVDSIAAFLKILHERNIPVLWRPLHEMNGEWFWWGNRPGPDGYQKLWKMLYDRMTNYHHLDNLIWVWNANAIREGQSGIVMWYGDYFPGRDYVDVLATDVYHNDWRKCHHNDLVALGGGKLCALGEVGELFTPKFLKLMPKFAWFMIWTTYTEPKHNTPEKIKAVFTLPNVVSIPKTYYNFGEVYE